MRRLSFRAGAVQRQASRLIAFTAMVSAFSCEDKHADYRASDLPPMRPVPAKTKRKSPLSQKPSPKEGAKAKSEPSVSPERRSKEEAKGCPPEMARIGSFCIDRWEIHLVGVNDRAYPENKVPPEKMEGLKAVSDQGMFPQGHMSQDMAEKACENAGKRLCSGKEWQLACRGQFNRKFPYGGERKKGVCNVDKRYPHILDKFFPETPHKKRTGRHFNDPNLLLDPDYLATTGEYKACVTPEGVFDMDGNLSEWTGDRGGAKGVFMGDAFSGSGRSGCGRRFGGHASRYRDYSMGTRCCKKAE